MGVQRMQAPFLAASVQSLLNQCDLLRVFLGEGVEPAACLEHSRIAVRQASYWDERGDAACFAWMDADDPPGFRVMARSGIVYPPNFCAVLSQTFARWGGRVIVGTDGWFLPQPFRTILDARHVSSLAFDCPVHVLATDAILLHSEQVQMAPDQFLGAPELTLARYAQAHALPMVVVHHRPGWLQRATPPSLAGQTVHRDAVWTVQSGPRRKVAIVLVADADERCTEAMAAWGEHTKDCVLVLIVVPTSSNGTLADSIAKCDVAHEIHIVPHIESTSAAIRLALRLVAAIGPDMAVITSDALRPMSPAWSAAALDLCSGGGAVFGATRGRGDGHPRFVTVRRSGSVAFICSGAALNAWLDHATLAERSADLAHLWEYARPAGVDIGLVTALERQFLLVGQNVLLVSPADSTVLPHRIPPLRVDSVFERRVVINLDRRVDRWNATSAELIRAGITVVRWPAIDATDPTVAEDYAHYRSTMPVDCHADMPTLQSSFEFFNDYLSQRSRVAYLEQKGTKAIASAGAWAYLRTWRDILHRSLQDGIGSILVMDDDIVLHRDTELLFAAAMASIPQDWLILQMGTLQHHWTPEWMTPCGSLLYRTNGAAVGSHAVGLREPVFRSLLAQIDRMEMPFDIGPLAAVIRSFRNRSFVIRPNIAIQRLDGMSDIQSSAFHSEFDIFAVAATYRWNLPDYPGLACAGVQTTI
jgi:hypothetical protein